MEKKDIPQKCIICEQEKQEGFYICTAFICNECEREIVKVEPEEEEYARYVAKLKKINTRSVFS